MRSKQAGALMRQPSPTHPILPICLLLADKPCLVVGGGTIASRKIGHLLDAAAAVTVVAPACTPELQKLAEAGKLRLIERPFTARDVTGQYLVLAATDNTTVNQRVLQACRKKGILCSAADSNWPDGDFILPATCRKHGLVITVATGGRSCRQARVIKDKIAEHLPAWTQADEE
jgi:siroheme synthase-like protein